MRDSWTETKLGNVSTHFRRTVKVDIGARYPAAGVMMEGRGLIDREPFVGGVSGYKKLTPISPGQLVLRSITAWEAPITIVPAEYVGRYVSGVFPVFDLDERQLHPAFMNLICQWPVFWNEMRMRATGSVLRRKTLSATQLQNIPLKIPPLSEQKRIFDVMATVDAYIAALQQQAAEARTARNAVLHELLTAGGDGWAEVSLMKLLSQSVGGVWGSDPDTDQEEVTVVRSTEFSKSGILRYKTGVARSIKSSQLSTRELSAGDILLEKSGGGPDQPVGRVVYVSADIPPRFVCSNFIQLLRPKTSEVHPKFLFLVMWMWHMQNRTLEYQAQTTGIRNLRTPDYLEQTLKLPPQADQYRIVETVSAMDDVLSSTEQAISDTKGLRSGLLSDLLSGDHEIPEAYDHPHGAA
jgi:type I restriction enzyme S subunit